MRRRRVGKPSAGEAGFMAFIVRLYVLLGSMAMLFPRVRLPLAAFSFED